MLLMGEHQGSLCASLHISTCRVFHWWIGEGQANNDQKYIKDASLTGNQVNGVSSNITMSQTDNLADEFDKTPVIYVYMSAVL